MDLTSQGPVGFLRSDAGKKWIRYSTVSLIGVTVSQIVILIVSGVFHMPGVPTNVLAVAISSIPAYILNRAWVWKKRGKNHIAKEVIPFWAFAFTGLVLSTLLVAVIVPHPKPPDAGWLYTLQVMIGNVGGFAVLWVAKFFVFEKLLFGESTHAKPVAAASESESVPTS